MATAQGNSTLPHKEAAPLKAALKRQNQGTPLEATPIKKRLMAAMNLSCRKLPESFTKTPHVKTEPMVMDSLGCSRSMGSNSNMGSHHSPRVRDGTEGALDLSPGLRHTLAQFTLSSQCSLGGPAAFSGHQNQDKLAPRLTPGGSVAGPLLVPPDSSMELVLCALEEESISCFSVGGELRLCLPQVLNTVLRDFSLQQINSVCDQLYVYCSRCDASQLHVLKVLGVLPLGAPSCGLITLTDAQRLCHSLLHSCDDAMPGSAGAFSDGEEEEREGEDTGGLWVEHQCFGKCQGVFVPRLYTCPDAPCIRCSQCRQLFSPRRYVMHSHHQPDKRTCHWGFDSAKWDCYLQLGRRYLGTAEEAKQTQLLEKMKLKFKNVQLQKRQLHPAVSSPGLLFDPQLLANMKEDPSQLELMWQSWYLHMHDKLIGPNVSLSHGCVVGKERSSLTEETQDNLLRQGRSQGTKQQSQNQESIELVAPITAAGKKTFRSAVQTQHEGPDTRRKLMVAIETPLCKSFFSSVNMEENKDNMVMEVLQIYSAQYEKLQSTLQKQRQLEKELDELRRGEAADASLQGELGEVQTEHAQKLGEVQREQRELKGRLEQLRRQCCRCTQAGGEQQQETQYAMQLSELRLRLDRAEEDREDLQEELRREREARQKLERTISELKQQIKQSVSSAGSASPLSTASSEAQLSPHP